MNVCNRCEIAYTALDCPCCDLEDEIKKLNKEREQEYKELTRDSDACCDRYESEIDRLSDRIDIFHAELIKRESEIDRLHSRVKSLKKT